VPSQVKAISSPFVSPRGEILPLTGLRIIAALWVVVFHVAGNFMSEYPGVAKVLWPLLHNGDLGVDLFFGLSGFVLTLNYVDKMGRKLERARTTSFLWARLCRVWPVYFVTLTIAALWHGGLLAAHSHDPVVPDEFSITSYLRQVFMVVVWTEPDFDRLTWNGPAWSVSAEWLAYTIFPVFVLLLARVDLVTRSRQLLTIGAVAMLPVAIFGLAGNGLYGASYLWLIRLFGAFVAGSLACLVARRIPRTVRTGRTGTAWSYVLIGSIVAVIYGAYAIDRPSMVVLVVFLFAPLLVALTISTGGPARLLSTRPFVLGGHFSYSVYLVHMLIIEPIWWAQSEWPGLLGGGQPAFHVLLPLIPVIVCVGGYVMWRFVEEPSRRKMRWMASHPALATAPVASEPPGPGEDAAALPIPPADHRVPNKV
jgi:peptidoglycan/LPS O-acetylase OafA/YrhL